MVAPGNQHRSYYSSCRYFKISITCKKILIAYSSFVMWACGKLWGSRKALKEELNYWVELELWTSSVVPSSALPECHGPFGPMGPLLSLKTPLRGSRLAAPVPKKLLRTVYLRVCMGHLSGPCCFISSCRSQVTCRSLSLSISPPDFVLHSPVPTWHDRFLSYCYHSPSSQLVCIM